MKIEIQDMTVTSVWAESFNDRNGEKVEFYRSLVTVPGEAPMQLNVSKYDFENLREIIGASGTGIVEIDARPGNRVRVYLRDLA